MEVIADRYDRDPAARPDGRVLHPARDRLTGATVTILQAPAPDDAEELAAEVDRLRRYARVLHPHLPEIREVRVHAGRLTVVCEPLRGEVLSSGEGRLAGTVQAVQGLAEDLLEALAALHRSGVVHGAVDGSCLLVSHRTGATSGLDVTLLPVPAAPDGTAPAGRSAAVPAGRRHRSDATPSDDVRAAATTLLALLQRTPTGGLDAAVLAAGLTRELERAGGVAPAPDGGTGPGAGPATAAAAEDGDPVAGAADGDPVAGAARRGSGAARRPLAAVAMATGAGATAAVAAVLLWSGEDAGPSAGSTPTARAQASVPPASTSPPQTVPALVEDLTLRPEAAGPAGPALRDGLAGLLSGDETVRQQALLQVLFLLIDGDGLDPEYATASRLAVMHTVTGQLAAPEVLGGAPSCLEITPGVPAPIVQGYAQQVLDRLPEWQADGLPAGEADRVQELIGPVAAGQADIVLRPCPGG